MKKVKATERRREIDRPMSKKKRSAMMSDQNDSINFFLIVR